MSRTFEPSIPVIGDADLRTDGAVIAIRDGRAAVIVSALIAFSVVLAGCSSLVDDPCASGYILEGNTCVERIARDSMVAVDGNPDGMTPDGMIDGVTLDGNPDGVTPDGTTDGPLPDGTTDGPLPDGTIDGTIDGPLPDGTTDGPGGDAPVVVDAPVIVDAPVVVDAPVTPDAPVCVLPSKVCGGTCTDVTTDPDDCGSCGHVCASGICTAGVCTGELAGHIVAIGHDYQQRNAAMSRVIGNAAALGSTGDLGIAHLAGTATQVSRDGTAAALASALASMGRMTHAVALPAVGSPLTGIDVLVIDAQTGDGASAQALGASWQVAIDALLARHGVVIVLEGAGGVSHRFASGAVLFTVATPIDATGSPAFVASAIDAITQQVVSPYLADTTSVVFPGVVGVIATPSGTVVMHLTR